jgi:hypothetical protein
MTHGVNGHETASYITQTGHTPGGKRIVYPSVGAVVNGFLGKGKTDEWEVPPYVVLTRPLGRFSEVGFLGLRFKPFVTGGDPNQKRFAVEGIVQQGVTDERQRQRRELLGTISTRWARRCPEGPALRAAGRVRGRGVRDDPRRRRQGLRPRQGDPDEVRERYGSKQVRAVLPGGPTARREGRPVHLDQLRGLGHPQAPLRVDEPQAAGDGSRHVRAARGPVGARAPGLHDRLVGRRVRSHAAQVQFEAPWNGGRNHFGACFTHVVAGGGFQGGTVVGASDARGETPAERPVHPRELIGSMYHLLGIDPNGPMAHARGFDVKALPPAKEGTNDGLLKEILP